MTEIQALLNFLDQSPTAWHAIDQVKMQLHAAGFTALSEDESWKLQPGKAYYVIRNGSSICAFFTPQEQIKRVHLVASHTDSPTFKLKPNAAFQKENMLLLGVEPYGAPLITSWLNRDLGIAGRVYYQDKSGQMKTSLVRLDEHPVILPQLAIHLDRKVNDEGLLLNKQEHLAALAGLTDSKESSQSYLETLIQKAIGQFSILSHELFLFPLEQAALIGKERELITAYRIDSLNSVHAALTAIRHAKPSKNDLKMIVLWDNEEIGSATAQGAASPFFNHVFERISIALGMNREDYLRCFSQSLCLSVDLAHAVHPNYSDRHEPRHPVLMQKGIAVKFNAQQRYASDAHSAAAFISLCKKLGVQTQSFITRNDILAGSTIGPIHAHLTGMPTVDIGSPQLSMHSCREIAAVKDYQDMVKVLSAFLGQTG